MGKEKELHPLTKFIASCLQSEGSTWIEEDVLKEKAKKYKKDIDDLDIVIRTGEIKKLPFDGVNYYSLPFYHLIESETAYNIMRILYSDKFGKKPSALVDEKIDKMEKDVGIKLHEQQRAAVHTMVQNSCCVITGGPGTGKTCTLNIALRVLEDLYPGINIKLSAPTGKAAHRITESTGRNARTVHRELHLSFTKSEPDYFNGDILVIDEVSMLDIETANAVFKSLRSGQRIILIGDTEQLPSVGPGAVLRDLLDSAVIPFTMLTKTFRQAEESPLFANILLTKSGKSDLVSDSEEFVIEKAMGGEKTVNQIADIFVKEVEKAGLENVVCLLPYRKAGSICSNKLNNVLQQRINPKKPDKKFMQARLETGEPVLYIVGDPVMQLVNRDECANGDVGVVIDVDVAHDQLVVKYKDPKNQDIIVRYWKSQLPTQLSLAYAMSVNKSQGSEYKTVIICMTLEHRSMLTRNMLYTGITRAKKRVVYIEERKATEIAMRNIAMYANEISKGRTTLLVEKLVFYKNIYEHAALTA